ncbi:MAG: hypothetical protein OEQ53_01565, partial [Saprospiraceae bacterium]|nr:hypothetical protein [Saprospiraceae bacterium]
MKERNGLFILLGLVLISCGPGKVITESVPESSQADFEVRDLDTLVINAPSDDKTLRGEYELPIYRKSSKRIIDLIHTKLDLRFDWEYEKVIGKATLTISPFFAPI